MVLAMNNKNNLLLKVENLNVSFSTNEESVVQALNLDIYEKDKFALIGESGSGKSVLILAILRLLEGAKISGRIFYKNKDLLRLSRKELDSIRGSMISYIPQGSGNGFNPLLNVGCQVGEPLVIHKGLSLKDSFKKAVETLRFFNFKNEEVLAKQYPHTFSGGMKQRAMIAMGIIGDAELVLADEPTKGLDSLRIKLVEDSLKRLEDKTYFVITHDLVFAKNISKRLGVIYSSYLVEEGLTEDIFKNPYHPYTKAMISALPENGLVVNSVFKSRPVSSTGCRYRSVCNECFEKCSKIPPMVELENRKVRCWKYVKS